MTTDTIPREGQLLPNFELLDTLGKSFRLRDLRGRRSLALIFIHSTVCRACRIYLVRAMDTYHEYADEGAEVLAVVPGERQRAIEMDADIGIPFRVLSDPEGIAFARYGLIPGQQAAVAVADRFGVPRIWQVVELEGHPALPAHADLVAEVRYLGITCSGGAPRTT